MRAAILRIGATFLALAAAGCRLDPPVPGHGVDVQASWRDHAREVATLANVAWFDVYRDDVLRGLVRRAIEGNPDLAAALAHVDEARAIAVATGADLYPRVDLSGQGGHVRLPKNQVGSGSRDMWNVSVAFDVTWELDLFGRVRSEAGASQARWYAATDVYRDVGIRLVAEVARTYFELRQLDEVLEIAERTLKSRAEYVDLAKVRFEGGKTSEIDFRQAESEYWRTEVTYVDVQRQISNKENALSILLGKSPGAVPRGIRGPDQPLPPFVPPGLPSDLLMRRPDVTAAEALLVSETALVGAARAALYPRIALTGSFGWESDQLKNLFSSDSITSSVIAGLLQPIFNAGRNRSLVEAQCARMRAAMEVYRKSVLVAFAEVESGLVDFRRFGEQRGVQARRLEALRKVLDLAETRYRGGVAQYLEVLDAQRGLFDAELEEAQTIASHLVSLTFLYKALGGGWDANYCGEAVPAPPRRVVPGPSGYPPSSAVPSSSTVPRSTAVVAPPPPTVPAAAPPSPQPETPAVAAPPAAPK